uniref:Uncharacterized protein n=1 Tax=Sphaerodactylus townsendi TaxID=933632 RepID=A0ACB8FSI7_9SAUR
MVGSEDVPVDWYSFPSDRPVDYKQPVDYKSLYLLDPGGTGWPPHQCGPEELGAHLQAYWAGWARLKKDWAQQERRPCPAVDCPSSILGHRYAGIQGRDHWRHPSVKSSKAKPKNPKLAMEVDPSFADLEGEGSCLPMPWSVMKATAEEDGGVEGPQSAFLRTEPAVVAPQWEFQLEKEVCWHQLELEVCWHQSLGNQVMEGNQFNPGALLHS